MQSDNEITAVAPQPKQNYLWFPVLFISIVLLTNFTALLIAAHDRYYLAFAIAIFFGPILNLTFASIGLVAWRVFRKRENFSTPFHLAMVLGLPFVASFFNTILILVASLDNGC